MSDKLGKINHRLFEESIHSKCGYKRREVNPGPGFGVDVSIIELPGETAIAVTSDPLSLIPSLGIEESAWLSVHLMANDIATTGFAPMYGQFVLNLPASMSEDDFKSYWDYIHKFCKAAGIAITGGHTGFIEGQDSTIAGGGTLFTIAPRVQMLTSAMARPGDVILVTKECAISSASILAMSFPETVKNKLGSEIFRKACEMFYETSSLNDALAAVDRKKGNNGPETLNDTAVTAMHDVTEGGVVGAIYELARASGNGAVVYNDRLPAGGETAAICSLFSIDPRYCVGAGSMIITCRRDKSPIVIERLRKKNIPCCAVGEIREKGSGITLVENGVENEIVYHEEDPYWAAFFRAIKKGWK
jgi:hydrogenase expression/formation protein HypE